MTGSSIGVFGLGNILMGDDAFGPWVIDWLRARFDMPPEVTVEDLGTPGLDLHPHLFGYRQVIFVDAVRATGPAGTVLRYTEEDILRHPPGLRLSPHDPGLAETLATFRLSGGGPDDVVLVGAVPEVVEHRVGLTAVVRDAVPVAGSRIMDQLAAWGVEGVTPKSEPPPSRPWWETNLV